MRVVSGQELTRVRASYPFAKLVQPELGVMSGVLEIVPSQGELGLSIRATTLGNLTMAFNHVRTFDGSDVRGEALGGGGASTDADDATMRAIAEGLERYACCVHDPREFIKASWDELGDEAIAFDRFPRCSAREYQDPRCPLVPPDRSAPIRWVKGYSLVHRRARFVPAVMNYLFLRPSSAERIWHPITTGVAAHTDLTSALLAATFEVVERDAIALTWLGQLSLPEITLDDEERSLLREQLGTLNRAAVDMRFFDATTDVGVPTVFSTQETPAHPYCAMYVTCATDVDPRRALVKAARESVAGRTVLRRRGTFPDDVRDFTALAHGATYYGEGHRRSAFDFLLDTTSRAAVAQPPGGAPWGNTKPDSKTALRCTLQRLAALNMDAVAVDMTTRELRDAGLWVVRVVVPELLPMITVQRARMLGTPRLYDYASRARGSALTEADVNSDPMPFA